VEGQFSKGGIAYLATVLQNGAKVKSLCSRMGNGFAGDSIVKGLAFAVAGDPAAQDIVL